MSCSKVHREHCHGMSPSFQQAYHHPPEGSPFQHHNSTSVRPNVTLWWQQNRRILWQATECHWSDTEEEHSYCVRRLECKSGQGYLWKLASHLWTLLQLWRKWERTQTSGVCNKASRRWIWHSPNGQHHSQTDYILVKNCSDQEWTLPGHEVFQEQTLEVTTTCWW